MIVLDEARRYLLFVQSNAIKARVPVADYKEYNDEAKKDLEKREELAVKYQELNLRGHQRKAKKVKEELEIHNKRIQTKMSASIDTSQKGVYILNYANAFETAFAIIPVY